MSPHELFARPTCRHRARMLRELVEHRRNRAPARLVNANRPHEERKQERDARTNDDALGAMPNRIVRTRLRCRHQATGCRSCCRSKSQVVPTHDQTRRAQARPRSEWLCRNPCPAIALPITVANNAPIATPVSVRARVRYAPPLSASATMNPASGAHPPTMGGKNGASRSGIAVASATRSPSHTAGRPGAMVEAARTWCVTVWRTGNSIALSQDKTPVSCVTAIPEAPHRPSLGLGSTVRRRTPC